MQEGRKQKYVKPRNKQDRVHFPCRVSLPTQYNTLLPAITPYVTSLATEQWLTA